jgi:hypothetical protein
MSTDANTPAETPASTAYSVTHTREAWLLKAVELMRPKMIEVFGEEIPQFRVSIGFAPNARAEVNGKILGCTVHPAYVSDGVVEVYISPEDADTTSMLITLLHEFVHVVVGNEEGHKGKFAEVATRLGFLSPMTETPPSVELAAEMMVMAAELGEYPGAQINLPSRVRPNVPVLVGPNGKPIKATSGPAKQGNRNIAIICPSCGWAGRSYRTQIERGLPFCGAENADGVPCMTRLIVK